MKIARLSPESIIAFPDDHITDDLLHSALDQFLDSDTSKSNTEDKHLNRDTPKSKNSCSIEESINKAMKQHEYVEPVQMMSGYTQQCKVTHLHQDKFETDSVVSTQKQENIYMTYAEKNILDLIGNDNDDCRDLSHLTGIHANGAENLTNNFDNLPPKVNLFKNIVFSDVDSPLSQNQHETVTVQQDIDKACLDEREIERSLDFNSQYSNEELSDEELLKICSVFDQN